MTSSPPPEQKEDNDKKYVKITLIDNEGNQIEYRIKRHIPLGKIVELYGKKYQKVVGQLRLNWNGRQVQKSETPESLQMDTQEELEILAPQIGGFY